MRTLSIPTGKLLVIPGETLPEDAAGITVKNGEVFWLSDMRGYGEESLPPGSWSLLGKASELTEEQIEFVCESYSESIGWSLDEDESKLPKIILWRNYGIEKPAPVSMLFSAVTDSYTSFLIFHGIKPEDVLLIEN